ncbi:MAG: RecX family transcriptional regulator [Clostridia bacterium]|nr:RecX family transcriptional regulator [Clostridia bacterium]
MDKMAPAKRGGAILLHLSDGSLLRLSPDAVVELGIAVGKELSEAELAALDARRVSEQTRKSAVNIISVTSVSCAELRRRLLRKGYPESECDAAVEWLCDMGVVDDAAFAAGLAAKYAAAGVSLRAAGQKMREKGLPRETVEEALAEYPEPDAAIDRAVEKALRGEIPTREQAAKLTASLARKGFRYEDIRAALRRHGTEDDDA